MRKSRAWILAMLAVTGGVFLVINATRNSRPQYKVVDLGPALSDVEYLSINDSGVVAGTRQLGKRQDSLGTIAQQAVLWKGGKVEAQPILAGYVDATAVDINNAGQIAGYCFEAGSGAVIAMFSEGVIWEEGRMRRLAPPRAFQASMPYAMNAHGVVVGFARDAWPAPGSTQRAVVWKTEKATVLPTLGGRHTTAMDINERGWIVGASQTKRTDSEYPNYGFYPCLWRDGKITQLGTEEGYAAAINDKGVVVGSAGCGKSKNCSGGFLWRSGHMVDLGCPKGFQGTNPSDINAKGEVVGWCSRAKESRAFIWRSGKIQLLDEMTGKGSGWVLQEAHAINNRGQIVGQGLLRNRKRAFMLVPNP